VAIGIFGALAGRGTAAPLAGVPVGNVRPLVSKVHGFHCRSVLGWNPVTGLYEYHRHAGICGNYRRCMRVQERCIFLLGRGLQRYNYEMFGADNWRYSSCMIHNGCY
jgi:hypothetical protein